MDIFLVGFVWPFIALLPLPAPSNDGETHNVSRPFGKDGRGLRCLVFKVAHIDNLALIVDVR